MSGEPNPPSDQAERLLLVMSRLRPCPASIPGAQFRTMYEVMYAKKPIAQRQMVSRRKSGANNCDRPARFVADEDSLIGALSGKGRFMRAKSISTLPRFSGERAR